MFYTDYHVHTSFSPDSEETMETMIQQGIALGLKEIAFTDHVDFGMEKMDFYTMTDYKEYYPHFLKLKEKYASRIHLLLGIENGYQDHVTKEMKEILKDAPFDFALMSVHCVDGNSCCSTEYENEALAITRYLETVVTAVSDFQNFDALAHLTFLSRYLKEKNIPFAMYREFFDEIFQLLIAGNKALEVNTSGYRYGLNAPIPDWELLKAYYQAGGRLITLGSDAHKKEQLALCFQTVTQGLEAIGFTHLCSFRRRQRFLRPINKQQYSHSQNIFAKNE